MDSIDPLDSDHAEYFMSVKAYLFVREARYMPLTSDPTQIYDETIFKLL